ncbi:GMP synthase (glutamine-hydrolysing) [Poseidonocella pacifica]|uniref:GMP synthase (Glutamine-hydrolysing) n=1 Tax=Poseidonocella pacifica TaxID=871651 RepID=A0A1I0VP87_9RHOB|nr:glutamine amidotransferase [Poseidonocella pacifica]SFA77720.1 GMP synthase (glutamine-hydrolysing) [Poseidonocella pacifica]
MGPRPFLILQARTEAEAADNEYEAFLSRGGLSDRDSHRVCLDREALPDGIDLGAYAGVIVGGGPGCVSDPAQSKDPVEARMEAALLSLMPQITQGDIPFLGCCYGIGLLAHHLGAEVSKARYGEAVGPVLCEQTGEDDPLLAGLPPRFEAFVGHKEAVQELPPGCVHLLSSAPCPFQMIRYKRNVYATQFHPEADGEVFALRVDLYRDRGYFAPEEADALMAQCRASETQYAPAILRAFVDRFR